ncbi:unnamed protein product [Cyprideis torosa]|uniref:Uncharacterized protein n=1 Tax=Cyprideis torosa TaxID=163714 RepID=A0A7R8WMN6_9CRUS|nr:unnamed protein product [Cyprideis torosa]CAG0905456.1 unnamed protein product [Cyprideis torosa]
MESILHVPVDKAEVDKAEYETEQNRLSLAEIVVPYLTFRWIRYSPSPLRGSDFSQMPTPVSMEECMLLFTVRDKGVAMNSFLGEAYLPVNELPVGCEADLAEFPQLSLPLSKPDLYNGDLGKDILAVLEQRVGFCREASDYFRKLKDRSVKPLLPPPKSGLLGSPRIGQRLKLGIPESLGQSILSLTNKGRKSSLGFIFNRMVPFQQKPMANKQLTAMNSTGANDSPKPSPKQKKTSNPT